MTYRWKLRCMQLFVKSEVSSIFKGLKWRSSGFYVEEIAFDAKRWLSTWRNYFIGLSAFGKYAKDAPSAFNGRRPWSDGTKCTSTSNSNADTTCRYRRCAGEWVDTWVKVLLFLEAAEYAYIWIVVASLYHCTLVLSMKFSCTRLGDCPHWSAARNIDNETLLSFTLLQVWSLQHNRFWLNDAARRSHLSSHCP